MKLCYAGLGSNQGDRLANLRAAVAHLAARGIQPVRVSSVYETSPVGTSESQPEYLNAVVAVETELEPKELVAAFLAIEHTLGRVRTTRNASRVIDIDLLLAGDLVCSDPEAIVPHPRMHERLFVLTLLREIAAQTMHPVLRKTITECREMCLSQSDEHVRLFAPSTAIYP